MSDEPIVRYLPTAIVPVSLVISFPSIYTDVDHDLERSTTLCHFLSISAEQEKFS